jgi:1,5-anhydro-D-fructose reductase (1,5-anhydro-D-mannitol-forming)
MAGHKAAVIGLGVMGMRMLGSMQRYAGFDVLCAWDPSDAACRAASREYPKLVIADDAEAAIGHEKVEVVYIACPPLQHDLYARLAMDAGKAVWCEKPLGVDIAASEALVNYAKAKGRVNIVNFSLASAAATGEIERLLADAQIGAVHGIDLRIHFSAWPRAWQQGAASWLALRHQGGFAREVVSHWVYLSQRLFGAVALDAAAARYPEPPGCETHLVAHATAASIPFSVACSVGGAGPDEVEYTLWGEHMSCRIVDWNRLFVCHAGGEWGAALTEIEDPREVGYERQLANAALAVSGGEHSMPDFAGALSVQRIIEKMLA